MDIFLPIFAFYFFITLGSSIYFGLFNTLAFIWSIKIELIIGTAIGIYIWTHYVISANA